MMRSQTHKYSEEPTVRDLNSRVTILTGASRGLGRHIARGLASKGARLALAARNAEMLEEVADSLRAGGATVEVIPTDVSQKAQLEHLHAETERRLGPVDLLINNAALERVTRYSTCDFDDIEADLNVNVRAVMYLTRLVLPGMVQRNRGHIVNMASLAALGGYAHGESYVATKHAVLGFTRALRASLQSEGRRVSASAVCPGYVSETGMFARKVSSHGSEAPGIMGTSSPDAVVKAVLKAIQTDAAEVVVNPRPVRPMVAMALLFPHVGEWLARKIGISGVSQRILDHEDA